MQIIKNHPSRSHIGRATALLLSLSLPFGVATQGFAAETPPASTPGGISGITKEAAKAAVSSPDIIGKEHSWLAPYNIE